jgi:hypothetical protein
MVAEIAALGPWQYQRRQAIIFRSGGVGIRAGVNPRAK